MTVTAGHRPARRRGAGLLDPRSDTFRSFADTLLVGVLVFVTAIPVVTGFAGMSAGADVLRRARLTDGHVGVRAFWRAFGDRVARHWPSHVIAPTAILALLVLNLLAMPYIVPDPTLAVAVPAVLATAAATLALRFAGAWRGGAPAVAAWRRAYGAMSTDVAGTVLLAGAVVTAGVLVAVAPLLLLIIAGPLVLATVAVDLRTPEVDS